MVNGQWSTLNCIRDKAAIITRLFLAAKIKNQQTLKYQTEKS